MRRTLVALAAAGFAAAASAQAPPSGPPAADAPQAEPAPPARIEDLSLEDLLAAQVTPGREGGFALRLEKYNVEMIFHAYATADFVWAQNKPSSMDLHYFNIFAGAKLGEVAFPEAQLEYEHGGSEIALRYAQIDLKASDLLVVRAGLMLVPFGQLNSFLYPEYLSRIDRNRLLRTVVPVVWNDVGVQLRGRHAFASGLAVNYAVYLVNGLEQKPKASDPAGRVPEGGNLRDLRGNVQDTFHPAKAVGGRLGVEPLGGLNLGVSAYAGPYTVDGRQWLSLVGADASYFTDRWSVHAEFAHAWQGMATGEPLLKWNAFAIVAYRVLPWLEPTAAFERTIVGSPAGNQTRWIVGVNLRPWSAYSENIVLRANYVIAVNQGEDVKDDTLLLQIAVGF